MIIVSPSKRQSETILKKGLEPIPFLKETQNLVSVLSQLTESELHAVLGVSQTLAHKAYSDYQALNPLSDSSVAAIELYRGDVFKSLDVDTLSEQDLQYLQDNLMIVSPLYGLITPFCGVWPYRLEMVSKIPNVPPLMVYWKGVMQELVDQKKPQYLFNLASKEYSSCIKAPKGTLWIDIVIEDKDSKGQYRVIAVKAKRVRGEILRFMAKNKIKDPGQLSQFKHQNYEFYKAISTPTKLVFRSR